MKTVFRIPKTPVKEFEKEYPNWNSLNSVNYNLAQIMAKWQDPKTADSILKG